MGHSLGPYFYLRLQPLLPTVATPVTYGCSVPLYLMGHSLGGSLALTLWGADLLPATHTGHATVVALGGSSPNPNPNPNPQLSPRPKPPKPKPKPAPKPNPEPKPSPKPKLSP